MKKRNNSYKVFIYIIGIITFFVVLYFSVNGKATIAFSSVRNVLYKPFTNISNNKKDIVGSAINEELKEENEELKKLNNITKSLTEFRIINATIIERNTSYWMETMIINKGKEDGVDIGMAVVVGEGLIGKVTNITSNTAVIKLITSTDNNNKVSVKIKYKETYLYKVLELDNNDLVIKGIDNSINLEEGATILTSGLSDIYPSGIVVGKISLIESDKYGTGKKLIISSEVDFNNLRFVSVLARGE